MLRRPALLALLLTTSACAGGGPSGDELVSPVQEQMYRHFGLARDLRSLVVTGELEALSEAAEELAETEPTWGLPPGSGPYLEEIRGAARRTADARSIEEAARAVADLSATCGNCHLANETDLGVRLQTSAPFLDDPAIRHPNYLSWVSRLLWDGLVGPSERTWSTGAGALAGGEDAYPPPTGDQVPDAANRDAAETFRRIGVEAVTAEDPAARAALVARMWTTCADCHTQAAVGR
jgi:mono/diheme cytochrome c family protein